MMKPRVLVGTAVLVVMSGAACNRAQTARDAERAAEQVKAGSERAAAEVKTAAAQAGDKLADSWLTAKIQAQFFVDDDIKSRFINVTSNDGVVRLKGFVESDNARRQVLEITRNTDGVKQVDAAQLLVGRPANESFETASMPPAAPIATSGQAPAATAPLDDATVASFVQARYFLDPTLKTRQITVQTMNGVVTLQGQVASETERSQALTLARSAPGVQRVEDGLVVDAGLQ
jgi:hyperosmotically inducible periplasmic protein